MRPATRPSSESGVVTLRRFSAKAELVIRWRSSNHFEAANPTSLPCFATKGSSTETHPSLNRLSRSSPEPRTLINNLTWRV